MSESVVSLLGDFISQPMRTRRVPVCVAIGEPVICPKIESPTQADIDKYHGLLLDAYKEVFDAHKEAYGWKHKTLQFV